MATGLVLAYDVAPGPTRAFTWTLAADAVADALQYVRGWLVRKTRDCGRGPVDGAVRRQRPGLWPPGS
ncbi:MAG: hypothetical protein ACN0LA_08915, partial [Candidatus Longimicrobiales bacterium M2_2A_002]